MRPYVAPKEIPMRNAIDRRPRRSSKHAVRRSTQENGTHSGYIFSYAPSHRVGPEAHLGSLRVEPLQDSNHKFDSTNLAPPIQPASASNRIAIF